jgi:hypothetical protein
MREPISTEHREAIIARISKQLIRGGPLSYQRLEYMLFLYGWVRMAEHNEDGSLRNFAPEEIIKPILADLIAQGDVTLDENTGFYHHKTRADYEVQFLGVQNG